MDSGRKESELQIIPCNGAYTRKWWRELFSSPEYVSISLVTEPKGVYDQTSTTHRIVGCRFLNSSVCHKGPLRNTPLRYCTHLACN